MPAWLRPSLNWLLVFGPAALLVRFRPDWAGAYQETILFGCASLAIIPLAGWLGRATEELADHFGPGVGGLLNATFGNATELIIALLALSRGLTEVVKASLTGSIIGNLLLVFGLSAFCGGLRHRAQHFNRTGARASTTSLSLAAIALVIPTIFHAAVAGRPAGWHPGAGRPLSLAIALVLLATYAAVLRFSLGTHRDLYAGEKAAGREEGAGAVRAGGGEGRAAVRPGSGDRRWPRGFALGVLLASTLLVAGCSELLVGSIEAARRQLGLTETFVGVIVVAVIGNAAEHSSAVQMAWKNRMELSIGVAIGSSLQIALLVAPVLVLASYGLGHPMDLEFSLPEVAAVVAAVSLVHQISGDGETNWLEGVQLLAVYLVIALLFYFLPPAG